MSISLLNGENLYNSFVSGALEVIENRKFLNDINVFPVADGDTGNNLASTMNSIIQDAKGLKSAKSTMSLIADAAITGARGNSGIIVAQYINGISMSLKDEEQISIDSFAESVQRAFPCAYSAISNPVEGTIITVIRDWSEAVYNQKDTAKDYHELLVHPLEVASRSLEKTTSMLKVLADSDVVDSGAKGFFHFIKGFTEFMRTGKLKEAVDVIEDIEISDYPNHDCGNIDFRYCTEALIGDKKINLDELKFELSSLGDSLIIAGNERKARIHIHSNNPEEVFKVLRNKGTILQQKADDMLRQYESAHKRKYNIALITDSIADLPKDLIDKYQINILPLSLVMENTSYLDKVTMTPEIFYNILDGLEEYPSSSQPSIKLVEGLYSSLLDHYDEILAITVAKEQSGTNNVFNKAIEKVIREGKRIHVIDSRQNSGAEGLLVMKAAELIDQGESLDSIVEKIEELRSKTRILVSVNTLKYMVRSGRIGKLGGMAGKLINLKPVISLDESGKGKIEDKAFSINSNTKKIMKIVKETNQKNKITRYSIVHANNPVRAEQYRQKCVAILNKEPEYIMNISTIVGMSAGVGSVAIAYMSEEVGNNE
ncbi:MAG: DegV family EDD domain-containing protein [Tissierellia bacterium]|nr:DegV family EDD domain-containing protein [Tissierellia bacterium]